jgi:mannose-6-phosphate isomerase-like protein (cupin superfamily)
VELSVVVDGTASVEVSGRITDVRQGDCFLLDSAEPHVIHNRSADAPLRVFTTFWMLRDEAAAEPAEPAVAAGEAR